MIANSALPPRDRRAAARRRAYGRLIPRSRSRHRMLGVVVGRACREFGNSPRAWRRSSAAANPRGLSRSDNRIEAASSTLSGAAAARARRRVRRHGVRSMRPLLSCVPDRFGRSGMPARGRRRQCDIRAGTVIVSRMPRVTPPSTNSRKRECRSRPSQSCRRWNRPHRTKSWRGTSMSARR